MSMNHRKPIALEDRGPLRVMFILNSMAVGGAETLLDNLIRRLDRERFQPSLCCLKTLGSLGEALADEIPAFDGLIANKYDARVLWRLARLFRRERIDAVVTVGAGDKMFWGRLAARAAGVPVVLSALHSTGWPDGIGRLNALRFLTRSTDGFIGVAEAHGKHLVEIERFPATKVHVIPNGVDVKRFRPLRDGLPLRRELGLSATAPVAGIVAVLRPEKNHELFLRVAAQVRSQVPEARFLIVGDGPLRSGLERLAEELGLADTVRFLGSRSDIPDLLAAIDVFVLTSKIEANPVSILEAMATGKPVIAPRVGSIGESVIDGQTGYLTEPDAESPVVEKVVELFRDPAKARGLGQAGRAAVVARWSLERMVEGYEELITEIYRRKSTSSGKIAPRATTDPENPVRPAEILP